MKLRFLSGLFFLLLAGAAPLQAAPLQIDFWHSMTGEKGRLLDAILKDFRATPEGQGIVVVPQFVGSYDEGLNKLRTALIAGRGPHVVQITDIGAAVMIDSESVEPLQNFIDKDPTFPVAQMLPAIRRYYEVGGKLYSLPFAISNPILYYNADLFHAAGIEHAPATMDELEATALKLTNAKEKRIGLTWPLHAWFLEEFMARQGAPLLLPENGRGTVGVSAGRPLQANYLSDEARAFISAWARMVKNGSFANVGRGWDPAEQNFLAGRVAMLVTSTSDILEVAREVPFKLGTAPIPGRTLDDKGGGVIVGGNSLWIMKGKPALELAATYAFVRYMASVAVQKRWHTGTGYFPIRGDVIDILKAEGFYDKFPVAMTAIEQMRASPDTFAARGAFTPVFPEMREHMMNAIEEVLSGRSDVETALKKAKAKSDLVLLRDSRSR